MSGDVFPLDGGCDCRTVRYRLRTRPLFVHCCHCRWCQRESGASLPQILAYQEERQRRLGG